MRRLSATAFLNALHGAADKRETVMNIVLHQPEIPQNAGNIARTCACTGSSLHLIRPLGFRLGEKHLKRAGLDYWDKLEIHEYDGLADYWDKLDVHVYDNFEDFLEKNPGAKIFMATTKGPRKYTDVSYGPDDFIMFGKETAGIPEDILARYKETSIRIPMLNELRSLNLANSVSIVLYEALRQLDFPGMQTAGELRNYRWDDL